MFGGIPWNIWQHSRKYLRTFPDRLHNIPLNVLPHFLESLATFPQIIEDIPRNVYQHFPECLVTFAGKFGDIPRTNIPPIYRVPRIPFSIPAFLVLYIARKHKKHKKLELHKRKTK